MHTRVHTCAHTCVHTPHLLRVRVHPMHTSHTCTRSHVCHTHICLHTRTRPHTCSHHIHLCTHITRLYTFTRTLLQHTPPLQINHRFARLPFPSWAPPPPAVTDPPPWHVPRVRIGRCRHLLFFQAFPATRKATVRLTLVPRIPWSVPSHC